MHAKRLRWTCMSYEGTISHMAHEDTDFHMSYEGTVSHMAHEGTDFHVT